MGDGLNYHVELRPASFEDIGFLFDLRNEPTVREASFNPAPVDWNTHTSWFRRCKSDGSLIYIVEINGVASGYVRFHPINSCDFDVAVALMPDARGQGAGSMAIAMASDLAEAAGARRLIARIRPENTASIRAFESAGYVSAENAERPEKVLERINTDASSR